MFLLGSYTEQIASEISTYLTVLTQDHTQVAAETAFVNLTYFVYNLSLGFALVGRSRYGYLHERATTTNPPLRFFCNFLFGLIALSILLGYGQFKLTAMILDTFAGKNPLVREHLASLIRLYAFALVLDFTVNFIFCLLRLINKLQVATTSNFLFIVVLQVLTGLPLVLYFKKNVFWIMANFYLLQTVSMSIATIVLFVYTKPVRIVAPAQEIKP